MTELDILKWAAGANVNLPNFKGLDDNRILYLLGVDEDKVYEMIARHRLAHRFLARFKQERPGGAAVFCFHVSLILLMRQNIGGSAN